MRLALGIEYDGSPFSGWQIQPDAFTIQGEVERGLSQIAAEPIRVFCAGRTDAGVHATYQIVHFDTEVVRPSGAWVRGLNALVSENISALWATEVAPDFHARYSALRRTYRYFLLNREQRPALLFRHFDHLNVRRRVLLGLLRLFPFAHLGMSLFSTSRQMRFCITWCVILSGLWFILEPGSSQLTG